MDNAGVRTTRSGLLAGRSPLLRFQSDERLIALIRSGHDGAFELLFERYRPRLLSFCRHMLGSKEDAEDVLQEVFAASYNAMRADDRDLNVRPWLYRIARNRCLNHLRRPRPDGRDTMDDQIGDHGVSTADIVHKRVDFRHLLEDIHKLPETQRTALLLREIDVLSYDQIADAMETTDPEREVTAGTRPHVTGRGRRGTPAHLQRRPARACRDRRGTQEIDVLRSGATCATASSAGSTGPSCERRAPRWRSRSRSARCSC